MKRILAVFLALAVVLTGCAPSTYRDDQVYIVNKGRHAAEKDELLNWLPVDGPRPFQEPAWPEEKLYEGDVPLYYDAFGQVLWLLEPIDSSPGIDGSVLLGGTSRTGRLVAWHLESDERQMVLESLPFVSKVILDGTSNRLYLFGGGSLVRVDLKRQKAVVETSAMRLGPLHNVFISPLEPRKLFLAVSGIAGGALYYPDTSRSVSLYQTRDRLYYKDVLEEPYYYATEWRSISEDQPDNLWTVVADERDRVVRMLGQGDFVAGYEKKVLIKGSSGFGLSLMTDINVPEEMVRICDEYVYEAGFTAGGEVYWIGDGKDEDKRYLLHLLDINGKKRLSVPISGSEVLVNESGRIAYSSGPAAEEIDLSNGKVLRERDIENPFTRLDAGLLTVMMLTVTQYGHYLLNDRTALEPLEEITPDASVREAMHDSEIEKGEPLQGRIHLAAKVSTSYFALLSNSAEIGFELAALNEQGRMVQRNLYVRYYRNGDAWQIEHFAVEPPE